MRRPAQRGALVLLTTLCALVAFGGAAQAANDVGPRQAFTGRVAGSFSNATVKVLCVGPVRPRQRGHPLGGQPLEVLSPLPPVPFGTTLSVGQTGARGTAIVARFAEDPSVPTIFTRYFADQDIPTSLLLPCGGTGKVVFVPRPSSSSSRSSVVAVTFVNLGV